MYSPTATLPLNPGALQAANSVINALLALNSAANFAIYCLVGKKFRRILHRRILRCGSSTAANDSMAPAAVSESVARMPPAVDVDSGRGGSVLVGATTGTILRSTYTDDISDCRKDVTCHIENRVVVVVVSANDAAATACSSPTTPSADDELTPLPIDTDCTEHKPDLHHDFDFDTLILTLI